MKAYGGILAGGLGTRMENAGKPKQLMELCGVPVLVRSVRNFLACPALDLVFVAMNAQWRDCAADLVAEHGLDCSRIRFVDGGETRFESLVKLAEACRSLSGQEDCVLLNHDCARPFVSQRILSDCLNLLNDHDMVTTSIPTIDTVLVSNDGKRSDCVPERSTIFLDQGPQAFRTRQFLSLVAALTHDERRQYMEAGRMYLDKGLSVGIVPGERTNFKLTTRIDIVLAEAMIKNGVIA